MHDKLAFEEQERNTARFKVLAEPGNQDRLRWLLTVFRAARDWMGRLARD